MSEKNKGVCKRNLKHTLLGDLNINFIWNKLNQIKGTVDIMVISETKCDETFPNGHFKVSGCALAFCLDCNQFGNGNMAFIREDIPYRLLSSNKSKEPLFVELNLRKR